MSRRCPGSAQPRLSALAPPFPANFIRLFQRAQNPRRAANRRAQGLYETGPRCRSGRGRKISNQIAVPTAADGRFRARATTGGSGPKGRTVGGRAVMESSNNVASCSRARPDVRHMVPEQRLPSASFPLRRFAPQRWPGRCHRRRELNAHPGFCRARLPRRWELATTPPRHQGTACRRNSMRMLKCTDLAAIEVAGSILRQAGIESLACAQK